MAGTRFYKAEAADGRFVDNSELAEALEPYARKTDVPEQQDLSGYARKEDIPSAPDLSSYALKSEIPGPPDLSGYVHDADLDGYAKKTDIPDVSGFAEKSALSAYALSSAIPDVSGLATKAEVTSGLAAKADTTALDGYQVKGDYALKSDLAAVKGGPAVLVLDAAAEVPEGTPAGTVIVRRAK